MFPGETKSAMSLIDGELPEPRAGLGQAAPEGGIRWRDSQGALEACVPGTWFNFLPGSQVCELGLN